MPDRLPDALAGTSRPGPTAPRLARAYLLVLLAVGAAVDASGQTTEPRPIDHGAFDALLKAYVNDQGLVNYAGLGKESARLDAYLTMLATAPLDQLPRDERLALLINAYNACTLRLILDHYPLKSIRDIPEAKRWKDDRWIIGGRKMSLDQIENAEIRPGFKEPRIHFAINCASRGCPPLRREAFTSSRLDEQLQTAAAAAHAHPTVLRLDRSGGTVSLSKVYEWFADDFRPLGATPVAAAARFSTELRQALESGARLKPMFIDWDWSLNDAR
jgi:hypothetical protein